MAYVLRKLHEQYSRLWELRDNRLNHMPFMENPMSWVMLVTVYLYIVKNGPKFMKDRKPFNIEKIIIIYNILQITANVTLFYQVTKYIFKPENNFSFVCQATDYSLSSKSMYEAYMSYSYFALKLFDYFDTIFFILRKKNEHVSFLHVYHHVLISFGAYICVLFSTGGQGTMLGYLNAFVHAVMYTYYLLSIWMPSVKSSKMIKANITRLQMVQFIYLFIHFGHNFILTKNDCNYPRFLSFLGATQNLFMIILFLDFYSKAYGKCSKIK